MCNKCLYCYGPLLNGESDYHTSCAKKFFGSSNPPVLPYSRDNISELALKVIQNSIAVTGVQPKLSLDINRGGRQQKDKLTIVGLWGSYILKPQSEKYNSMPELEDVTMKMAAIAGIPTAEHCLIRMTDGELAYITKRMDRGKSGVKYSMLDMCQLSNRLTEHKYRGSYLQLASVVKSYSSQSMIDVQNFWKLVLFSWISGNSDMHCKNFSLIDMKDGRGYVMAPAYDLLAVLLTGIEDNDEMAMTLIGSGVGDTQYIGGYNRSSFVDAMEMSGVEGKYANKVIDKMVTFKEKWYDIIGKSFLSEKLKEAYFLLLENRINRLKI